MGTFIIVRDELSHHGVKGMKWGVRKEYNKGYSSEQRLRDRTIYGRGGVRRINRSMNKGHSISSARSRESDRIYKYRRLGTTMGQVGAAAGGVGGALAGYRLSKRILKKYGTGDPTTDMAMSLAVSAGVSSGSQTLARSGGQSLAMIMGGYSPSKFRYS